MRGQDDKSASGKQNRRKRGNRGPGFGLNAGNIEAQQAPANLGSDSTFVLVARTTVTVTGGGTIKGNIGIYPGTAYVPGTPAVTVGGTVYQGGPIAAQAQADLTTAYNNAAGRSTAPVTLSGNIGLLPGFINPLRRWRSRRGISRSTRRGKATRSGFSRLPRR